MVASDVWWQHQMVGHPNPQHKVEKPSRLFVNLKKSKSFSTSNAKQNAIWTGLVGWILGPKEKTFKVRLFLIFRYKLNHIQLIFYTIFFLIKILKYIFLPLRDAKLLIK